MMRKLMPLLFAAGVLAVAVPVHAEVRLTMRDGKVTLKATNATIREILAEWAKVGQTRIINGERITGGGVTLELTDMPEGQALEVLLRSVAGYMAAPRAAAAPALSNFDRILILPSSVPPRAVASAPPAPTFSTPQFNPPPPDDDDDGQRNAVPNPRAPIFNAFPPPQQPGQQPAQPVRGLPAPSPSGPTGQMPVGVSVPGMIVQPPQQNPQ
jgi:hypothetical protein